MSAMIGSRPAAVGGGLRKELEVIDRGAGALRDARHGGRLRQVTLGLGDPDQPIGEHAATLAAQGGDGQLDRPRALMA